MMSKGSKERSTGSMAGYFDNEFKTIPGSYIDPMSMRRRARIEEKKKNIVTKPFVSMYRPNDPYVKRFFLMLNKNFVFIGKDWVHSMEL